MEDPQEHERIERERKEDLEAYENYLRTGNAIENKEVVGWLTELAKGKYISWEEYISSK